MVKSSEVTLQNYKSEQKPTWCAGCGDFGILNAIQMALLALNIPPYKALIASGIGCGSKLPDYINANGYLTIHGRALPVLTGIHLANHELVTIAVTGDGDGYGIGGNHFMHAMRRNINITHIVENNQIYGLTKGQYSPTTDKGMITSTSPEGAIEYAVNPITWALAAGATFIARGFANDPKKLTNLIQAAIKHKGYALIDVLQPCVTYNKQNTKEWYEERIYYVDKIPDYNPKDIKKAFSIGLEWGEKIPCGVIYQTEKETYEDNLFQITEEPLVEQVVSPSLEDFEKIKSKYY
ncbi:MAG: 2-oxoacid:ferredoxin oxidoreductase subunit beta [Candidatus Melainabacteria bacterium]|nr:2-oxoacid:ferredoxin oxidoreductase subunit beta [Candidatus Melainabacteria bacterium]